jgi:hypothetical protein
LGSSAMCNKFFCNVLGEGGEAKTVDGGRGSGFVDGFEISQPFVALKESDLLLVML